MKSENENDTHDEHVQGYLFFFYAKRKHGN